MVIQLESRPGLTIGQEREYMVAEVFEGLGRLTVDDSVVTDATWRPIDVGPEKRQLGDEAVQLIDNGEPTLVTIEKRAWDLSAPGIIVFNGLKKVFNGTIENALQYVERDLGFNL